MNALHYLSNFSPAAGGVTTAVTALCNALAGSDVDVSVLTPSKDAPASWNGEASPRVMTVPHVAAERLFRAAACQELDKLVAGYGLVHLHTPWNTRNLSMAAACERAGVPYIVTLHGMIDRWSMNNGWRKALKKRAYLQIRGARFLRRAAAVHCTAETESEQASYFVPGIRTIVLPLVFDAGSLVEIHRNSSPAFAPPVTLLYLSRLHPKKRPDLVISALGLLPNARAIIAGPGDPAYVEKLKRMATTSGVEDRVTFPGMLSGSQLHDTYQEGDIFVLPTSQENFGIVLTEAMAAGMPVITTRGTAIWPELQAAGAWIVEQSVSAIKAAVDEIRQHPEEAVSRASRGREWATTALHPEVLGPKYAAFYYSIAAS